MTMRTFVMVKPLGLQNFLLEVMAAVKAVGTVSRRQLVVVSRELIAAHYAEHAGKEFFARLLEYYQGQTVMALVVDGPDAVARVRAMLGPSDPRRAAPGQLRHLVMTRWRDGQSGWRALELATSGVDNIVHASDSAEAAEREIALWFGGKEE
ncbi:MAG: nucleoside-diphosphate kinase [Candidatus Magasanikbacteria bacterium]|nr:nucleoside-diphosphate kinase [Candidatus Magasanikbacteria bacterium]